MAEKKQASAAPGSGVDRQEARIMALEEQLAHQVRVGEELSGMVSAQWNEIDTLKKRLSNLAKRFVDLEESGGSHPEITKPPHY
jgi:SlyX protein